MVGGKRPVVDVPAPGRVLGDGGQGVAELVWDGKPDAGSVFHDRQALIGQVEEDRGCPKDSSFTEDVDVEDVGQAYQGEDHDLAGDALKPHRAGELPGGEGGDHAGCVVDGHEGDQGEQEAVCASEKPAHNASNRGEKGV